MAASVKNKGGLPTKLTRGFPANLGTISAANDVVAFTIPEPSRDHQGNIVIQVSAGLITPTFKLEASIDGGSSWFDISISPVTTADFGDTACSGAVQVNVSGFGAGAVFRFGRNDAGGGSAAVFALVG